MPSYFISTDGMHSSFQVVESGLIWALLRYRDGAS